MERLHKKVYLALRVVNMVPCDLKKKYRLGLGLNLSWSALCHRTQVFQIIAIILKVQS